MNKHNFADLALKPELIENLSSLGYDETTPIQAQSLPYIIDGKDVLAQAKTGSGKTAAFGLGLLNKLKVKRFRIQALVLCPTRELADQVAKEIRRLARSIHNIKVLTLCGGMPFGPQVGSLEHGAHIIVGTPGRIEDHVRKGNLRLNDVDTLVLDEADRMLDMGFEDSLNSILEDVPQQRQTLLFSATYPKQITQIASNYMQDPIRVEVESNHSSQSIEQLFYEVDSHSSRIEALRRLLLKYQPASSIVFCSTKKETQEVADQLSEFGFSALGLHGDMEQRQRDQTLVRFANKSASILVATDVAARGLDIESLDAVFNYQPSRDSDVHVHRIGRTGRGGKSGMAFTIYTEKERFRIERLEERMDNNFVSQELPSDNEIAVRPFYPPMRTIQIDGGKKQKLRAGDILGALTRDKTLDSKEVGKISIFDFSAYVAVEHKVSKKALRRLSEGKMKGRSFRARFV